MSVVYAKIKVSSAPRKNLTKMKVVVIGVGGTLRTKEEFNIPSEVTDFHFAHENNCKTRDSSDLKYHYYVCLMDKFNGIKDFYTVIPDILA